MKRLTLIFIALMAVFTANAQNFTATVNTTNPAVGDRIQITFSLQNAGGTDFRPPNFKGFTTLMGPSTQQSTSIINGRMSQSVSWTYVLQADMEGSFTIGPASIKSNGKTLQSNPINIKVSKGSAQQQQQHQQQQTQEKDMNKQANDIIKKNLFVTLSVNKTNVYQGEQIVATYKLYINPDLTTRQIVPKNAPSFNGFWTQELENKQIEWSREVLNGTAYKVAVVRKVVLIPQQTGKLVIEPYDFDCVVSLLIQNNQRQRRSMFDDFFFDQGRYKDFQYLAKSKTEYVNVKPLPSNAPAEFSGGVGDMEMKAWIDKTKSKTGDPITLKIKISGSGNLKLLQPLKLNLPPDFETYDPKINDNVNVTASGVSGSVVFEYLLLPRHAGDYKIDPVHFSYYNLNQKKYVTLSSEAFNVKIEQGAAGSDVVKGVGKEDVKYIGKDIRFIKNAAALNKGQSNFAGSVIYWLLLILPVIISMLLLVYLRKKRELEGDYVLMRNKRATKVAMKRLAVARRYMTQGTRDKFYEELDKGLWGYLSDKLRIPYSELSKDNAREKLLAGKLDEESIRHYMEAVDHCEFARYAPSAPGTSMEEVYSIATQAITKMEEVIR